MFERGQLQANLHSVAQQLDLAMREARVQERLMLVLGPAVHNDPAPEAQRLRSLGATWEWVALGFAGWRFWDLHVGVLVGESPQSLFRVGLHWRACVDGLIAPVVASAAPGGTVTYSAVADEYQYKLPANTSSSPGWPALPALSLARRIDETIPDTQPGTNAGANPLAASERMLEWK